MGSRLTVFSYIQILRPVNVLMAGCAVCLGFWLSHAHNGYTVILLTISAFAATGFGNVINDILDLPSDRISHPDRPLPRGQISTTAAWIFAVILSVTSLVPAVNVSLTHLIATVIPLLFLIAYARWLKNTPLAGNFLVASLVAYPLLFGGLTAPGFIRLIIPAVCAFLLNFSREIIKTLQDEQGDKTAGLTTSAILPVPLLKKIVFGTGILYLPLMYLPFLSRQFGFAYLVICSGLALPVHLLWMIRFLRRRHQASPSSISRLIKLEMSFGLLALAVDEILYRFHILT
jgi:geranylgeranylglycerol-phosphate geranylgeranyltransferase